MTENTAIEFLFFSYFGIDLKDENDQDTLLDVAISRAYRDAASHVLQLKIEEKLTDKEKENIVNTYKAIASKEIFKELEKMPQEGPKSEWVEELAKKLIPIYEPLTNADLEGLLKSDKYEPYDLANLKEFTRTENVFTFGIAQKWINMTIKNIYVMDTIIKQYTKKGESKLSALCDKVKAHEIDIPVDDYIIKASCNAFSIDVPSGEKEYTGTSDDYAKKLAWSKWKLPDKENEVSYYSTFQETLKKKLGSMSGFGESDDILDRENRLWIDAATEKYDGKINKEGAQ